MMVATYKCGCPPPSKEPCSPCCTSGNKATIKPSGPHSCPIRPCCEKRPPKPAFPLPKIEEPPPCCPMMPPSDCDDFERPHKLRSEIAESGLPYDEFDVIINENKLVIRTQKELIKPQYDPPCDCIEDPSSGPQYTQEMDPAQGSENRTVILYPRSKYSNTEIDDENVQNIEEEVTYTRPFDQEENPNIFLLRVKKKSTDGDKNFNVDLEFRTPRPWSKETRLEYEKQAKTAELQGLSSMKTYQKKEKGKRDRSKSHNERKKK